MFHLFPNFKSKILLDRVLGEPNIYHYLGVFYKNGGFYLEGFLTCEGLVGVTHRR